MQQQHLTLSMPQIVLINNNLTSFTMAQEEPDIETYLTLADRNTYGYYQRPQLLEVVGDQQMDSRTRHLRHHSFVTAARDALQANGMVAWDIDEPEG